MAPDWFEPICVGGMRASAAIVVLMLIASFILMTLFMVSSALVLLSYLAFGGSLLKAGPFLELAVEPLPQGSYTLNVLTWGGVPRRNALSLMHSESYLTREALERIAAWVRSVV